MATPAALRATPWKGAAPAARQSRFRGALGQTSSLRHPCIRTDVTFC
jgi:hypothetical protein